MKLTHALPVVLVLAGCGVVAGVEELTYEAPNTPAPAPSAAPVGPGAPAAPSATATDTTPPGNPTESSSGMPPVITSTDASTNPPIVPVPVDAGLPVVVDAGVPPNPDDPDEDDGNDPDHPQGGGFRCKPNDWVNARPPNANRVVTFPGADPASPLYAPACIRIRVGQSVTFQGDFVTYPLSPNGQNAGGGWGGGGGNGGGGPLLVSPILPVAVGQAAVVTFPQKGRFRYRSTATTLRGVVDVRP